MVLLAAFLGTGGGIAAQPLNRTNNTFSLYFENDTFNQTDRHYTNGFKVTLISDVSGHQKSGPEQWIEKWTDNTPEIKGIGVKRDISFSLGQNIYTPVDIEQRDLIENDRPYAGISYLSLGFHSKRRERMDTLEIYAGIVGPHSYAEDVQKKVHDIVGSGNPGGWEHQLADEPVIGATYEQKRKLYKNQWASGLGYDVSLNFGGGLGNAYTYFNCGSSFRIGLNIPSDFGTCRILPVSCDNSIVENQTAHNFFQKHHLGLYIFVSVDGQAVLRNIFLDGNTFQESHYVKKYPLVADMLVGAALIKGNFRISAASVYRTKTFKKQGKEQEYTSLNLSYSY